MISKYKLENEQIDNLNYSNKERILTLLKSILISFLCVIGFIALFINLFIYTDLVFFNIIALGICVLFFLFFTNYLYLNALVKGKFSIKYTLLFDFIITFIAITIIVIIAIWEVDKWGLVS